VRAPSCLLPAVLCLVACSVDVAGTAPDEIEFPDGGGGIDSGVIPFGDGGGPLTGDATVQSCTGATQETRVRFEQAQVVAPATCNSETQRRSCSGGTFGAWSGSFSAEACELAPYNSCGNTVHGGQEKRTRYASAIGTPACQKEEQSRTCSDGTFSDWTGSYAVESCAIAFLGGCELFGGEFSCESGTVCMLKGGLSLDAVCVGSLNHACSANGDCITGTSCIAGKCAIKSSPGGACEEQSDCNGCGSNNSVSCAQNVCACSDNSSCSSNSQCLGTCVASKCVPANTTCDNADDCRDGYQCKMAGGKPKGCYLPDGAACTANSNCEHVCRAGQCAPLGGASEVCDEDADCGKVAMQQLSCVPIMAGSIVYNACSVP
jgi:hypothetical protein